MSVRPATALAWLLACALTCLAEGEEKGPVPAGPAVPADGGAPGGGAGRDPYENTPISWDEEATGTGRARDEVSDDAGLVSVLGWTGAVLLLFCAGVFLLRRFAPGARRLFASRAIQVLGRRALNNTTSLCLVEVGSRILRLAVSKNQVVYLGEIAEPDEVATVKSLCPPPRGASAGNGFDAVFRDSLKEADRARAPKEPQERNDTVDEVKAELSEIQKVLRSWRNA